MRGIVALALVTLIMVVFMVSVLPVPASPPFSLSEEVIYQYSKGAPLLGINRSWWVYHNGSAAYSDNTRTVTVQLDASSIAELNQFIQGLTFVPRQRMLYQQLFIDEYKCTECLFVGHLVQYRGRTYVVEEAEVLRSVIVEIEQKRGVGYPSSANKVP